MRKLKITTILLLSIFVLAGCLEVQTTVSVKPDGSGTVRERVLVKSDMLIMMMKMAKSMKEDGDENGKKKKSGLFDEQELREKAETMGEGVTYKSGKILSSDDGEGYEATYAFKDINTLHVSETPDIEPPSPSSPDEDEGEEEKSEKKEITFEFTKGSPATLVVHVPPSNRNKDTKDEPEDEQEETESGIEMARMMLKDLRISTVVEVQGTVVESDASFRDKSKITLMDIDFGKLLADENLIRKAMKRNDISDDEARALMKEYPGLKIELNKTTTVRFR